MQGRILNVLDVLIASPFEPELKTHKLRGQLAGLWVSWVEYDCRVVFAFVPDLPNEDAIVLVDIGSHDEVY